MSEKRDYYEVLGLSKGASAEEIKKAFKRMAAKYHPDRNPGDKTAEENFKAVNEAYSVLGDEQKKAAYDRFGHAGVDPNAAGAGGNPFAGAGGFGDLGDIFSEIFGGAAGRASGRGGPQAFRGGDLRYDLDVTLEQAAEGCTTTIRVPAWDECPECHGTGAKAGTRRRTCGTCHGSGQVRMSQGFFSVTQTCPECGGIGTVIDTPCPHCRGKGQVKRTRTINVSIPAGISNGQRIRHTGYGEPGVNGGEPGDLYIEVHVHAHDIFERDGDDLHAEVPISFAQATLGGKLEVPVLGGGKVTINLPEGTQTGKTFRLREKGIKGLRSGVRGDLYIHTVVETPLRLTEEQKDLLRRFDASLRGEKDAGHSPKSDSFFDSVKNIFK